MLAVVGAAGLLVRHLGRAVSGSAGAAGVVLLAAGAGQYSRPLFPIVLGAGLLVLAWETHR
jgi:hypothetical protein